LLEDKADASGLLFRRHRQYDPSTGRFTQEDPLGLAGGMNLYGYAGGDPVNYSDPLGLCPIAAPSNGWGLFARTAKTEDCPNNEIGKALRTIEAHAGATGQKALGAIANEKLSIMQLGGDFLDNECHGHQACTPNGTTKLVVNSAAHNSDLAVLIFHEAMHHAWSNKNLSIEETGIWEAQLDFYSAIPNASSPLLELDESVKNRNRMGRAKFNRYVCQIATEYYRSPCPP
jgi:RHS repeat-associated protein